MAKSHHPLDANRKALANQYNAHHFACAACIAAGRGQQYGARCNTGASLWRAYSNNQPNQK